MFKTIAGFARVLARYPLCCGSLLAGTVLAGSSASAMAATCASLASARLPNVTITSATSIPAGTYQPPGSPVAFTNLPAFCRVVATVRPVPDSSIAIEVWLPATTWNGRYQQVGNHGWGSGIYWSEMAPQLQRGFATAATDDGHPSTPAGGLNVSWAFGHPAKLDDFAWRAVHELAEKAKRLIAEFYGKPPEFAYFDGCSDGGREGLREAQDFPADFDGILIGGVASYWTRSATELFFYSENLINSGIQGTSGAAILTLAQNAATAACDAADRVGDGLIDNPARCHWDPHSLICVAGQNPAACITQAQADAIAANIYSVRDPVTGKWLFPGMERGSEFVQIGAGRNNGINPFALMTYRLGLNDPNFNGSTFDLHVQWPKVDRTLGIMNTINPDLRPFAARGGKLIQWHGWDDASFVPGWETDYYNDVVRFTGNGNLRDVQKFYRLFMLPGVGHCAPNYDIGPDNIGAENQIAVSPDPQHDAVSALLEWREKNVAPSELIATKFINNDPTQPIQMQRPIYPYPAQAVYNGLGSTNDASNFHSSGNNIGRPWWYNRDEDDR